MTDLPVPDDLAEAVADALEPVFGPVVDDLELNPHVGDEPPEAVELTDAQRFLQYGA